MFNEFLEPQDETVGPLGLTRRRTTAPDTSCLDVRIRVFVMASFVLEEGSGEPDYPSLVEKITNKIQSFDEQQLNNQFIELCFDARHLLTAYDNIGLSSFPDMGDLGSRSAFNKYLFVRCLRAIALDLFYEHNWISAPVLYNGESLSTIVNEVKETREVSEWFSLMFIMWKDGPQVNSEQPSTSHQPKRVRR